MIKRIRVKNFRSLKDVSVELDLRNILVGPNTSGKSNFLDALKFLTHIASVGLNRAFGDRGGFNEVFWKGASSDSVISFEGNFDVSVDREATPIEFNYVIEIEGSQTGLLTVRKEILRAKTLSGWVILINITSGHGAIHHLDGSKAADAPGNPSLSMLEFNLPNWAGGQFKQYLSSWHFYKLAPVLMKQLKASRSAAFLTEMGDNLVEFLTTLKTSHTDSFRRIEQVVRDTFPDVEELIPQLTQYGQVFLSAREKFLQKPVTVWNMADGELVFIALLALIFSPPELGAPVVCVEEPENHLHPRLLETLVEVLRQNENVLQAEGVPPSQLFATTHSPYLVDQWGLDELLVFEKVNGETRISRPRDKEHLRKLLSQEKLGLGELWYSGALGGV